MIIRAIPQLTRLRVDSRPESKLTVDQYGVDLRFSVRNKTAARRNTNLSPTNKT